MESGPGPRGQVGGVTVTPATDGDRVSAGRTGAFGGRRDRGPAPAVAAGAVGTAVIAFGDSIYVPALESLRRRPGG